MAVRPSAPLVQALSLCCLWLICTGSPLSVIEENIVIKDNRKPNENHCELKSTFVPWKEVSQYLTKHIGMEIAQTVKWAPLEVKRCRDFLAPCPSGNTYCGVKTENRLERTLQLMEGNKKLNSTITLEYLEDKTCHCVKKTTYDYFAYSDVSDPPVIIRAQINKIYVE